MIGSDRKAMIKYEKGIMQLGWLRVTLNCILSLSSSRYMEAPVESSTYPDKNTVANSLSTSIIANRFLVEAGERPQSMIIHYADIASIHILVLKVGHTLTFIP